MRNSIRVFLATMFAFVFTAQGEVADDKLSIETTRALLENLSGLPPPIGGPIPEEEYLALRAPLTLVLQGGREFEGTVAGIDEETIRLRLVQEGGEVVLSFPLDDVVAIEFPGEPVVDATLETVKTGELSDALPYLESIIGARYALFPLIPPEELSFFRALPLAALVVDNPAQAIAYVRAISPYLTKPDDQKELRDVELLAYYRIQLREEAEEQARAWIDSEDRFSESALGYFILSALQFESGDYEGSLETALYPIVFSGVLHKRYLAPCYSLAITSAHLLNDPIERDKLIAEMQQRNIPWEPLGVFRQSKEGLSDLLIEDLKGNSLPILPVDDSAEILLDSGQGPAEAESFLDPANLVPL